MWCRWCARVGLVVLIGTTVGVDGLKAQSAGIREVVASDRSLTPLQTRLRFTTMIVLPEEEEILDVICGDRDWWVITATQNIAHVKPAKEGASTNLNLVTASGAVYSFLLTEKNAAGTTDLKVYVTSDPERVRAKPRYYSATHVEELQAQIAEMRTALESARRQATDDIASFQQQYPARLQFTYRLSKYEKPFLIRAIWHDGQFTYIKSDATELPALYELKDGQPALVNFQVHHGTYVVPRVLDSGYLALGKSRWSFAQEER